MLNIEERELTPRERNEVEIPGYIATVAYASTTPRTTFVEHKIPLIPRNAAISWYSRTITTTVLTHTGTLVYLLFFTARYATTGLGVLFGLATSGVPLGALVHGSSKCLGLGGEASSSSVLCLTTNQMRSVSSALPTLSEALTLSRRLFMAGHRHSSQALL